LIFDELSNSGPAAGAICRRICGPSWTGCHGAWKSTLERRSGRWRMSKAMPEDTVREKAEELRALYGLG
jgi:hypothetical protein